MVCSGHHWKPNVVSFKAQDKFKGKVLHSHAYKDQKGFEDKTVVVVGIGNSGVDVAVELSRHSKQVYLATRSGAWIASRIQYGLPADLVANTRLGYYLPFSVREKLGQVMLQQITGDIGNFGLKAKFSALSAHPTINGELLGRIIVGSVIAKPNIAEFTGDKSLRFEDGTVLEDVDVVILCTGYEIDFPFMDSVSTGFKVTDNFVDLYKYVFLPPPKSNTKRKVWPTLSFIGLIQPWGAIMPISEMQGRWVTQALTGKRRLPSGQEMWRDIEAKKVEMGHRYKSSKRHTIQVEYVDYMDELAALIDAAPTFWRLFFGVSPSFAVRSVFGPVVPPYYRIFGHGKWNGAVKAVNELFVRNYYPTRTRVVAEVKGSNFKTRAIIALIVLLLVIRFLRRR